MSVVASGERRVTVPGDTASPGGAAKGAARALGAFLTGPGLLGLLWFVLVFATIALTWGRNPLTFPSPDEAVNRLAAKLVTEHGRPFLRLPFEDVEDLAHPRLWLTLGDHAVPAYAPATIYLYGFLIKLRGVGLWLIPALPAMGAAAFTLGTARLLPPRRRWLSVLAPVLGFPGLYWLLRPWMNISLLVVCLCCSFYGWARFRGLPDGKSRTRWLFAMFAFVGAGAAVRPDYTLYILLAAVFFALAECRGAEWKLVLLGAGVAGGFALAVNMVLNLAITGKPLRAAYQILVERQPQDEDFVPVLPGIFGSLVAPMGLLKPSEVWKLLVKYWFTMRPLGLLAIGQLAVVPLLAGMRPRRRALYAAALLVIVALAVTRLSLDVFGWKVSKGWAHHSVPRYLAPIYLFAALPPLVYLGRRPPGVTFFYGAVFAFVLAWRSGFEIYDHQSNSLKFLHDLVIKNERTLAILERHVKPGALVYTNTQDKLLWARFNVGVLGGAEATAASMKRARDAGMPVFIVQSSPGVPGGQYRKLVEALKADRLRLQRVDARRGVYRLDAIPPT